MIRINNVSLPLEYNDTFLVNTAAKKLGLSADKIISAKIVKRSIDARHKDSIHFTASLSVCVDNEIAVLDACKDNPSILSETPYAYIIPHINKKLSTRPVIAGFGPAGMFAALVLAQAGAEPIVLERGIDVDSRKAKVQNFWNNRMLDTECNVQFGEGGAGTFSDGKLTTGIKDIRIRKVFEEFVSHGAPEEILWTSKPHIGTDKLAETVKNIRNHIISLGGQVLFGAKLCGFSSHKGCLRSVSYTKDNKESFIETENLILASGHSSRDTFELLKKENIPLSQKKFAVGLRIEHLQTDINKSMYGKFADHPALDAADYKLAVHLKNNRSLYTFCMCPGGFVVASASEENTVVTNGMSFFKRDAVNANSALLVGVSPQDLNSPDPLAGITFQRKLEHAAFISGGSDYNAPVCLVGDFINNKLSNSFGKVLPSYMPSAVFAMPDSYLPDFVCETLRLGIPEMGKKIKGFNAYDAVLTGVESRSSSPVRINRDDSLQSPALKGLYPCGEGAGYAGGIVSAAVDGIKCAEKIISFSSK